MNVRQEIAAVLGFASVAVLTFPFAAQWVDAKAQHEAAEQWQGGIQAADPAWIIEQRELTTSYNDALAHGLIPSSNYTDMMRLPSFDVMARLIIPAIDLDQPIRHGMSETVLREGVGHAPESSLPVGGPGTHAVLGGHRGMAESIGFTKLPNLTIGDEFTIDVLGEHHQYRVIKTEVLDPEVAAIHSIKPGRDLVTLLTCTPLGINSQRFVVTGERIPTTSENIEPAVAPVGFPWWAIWSATGFLTVTAMTVFSIRHGHTRRPAHSKELS